MRIKSLINSDKKMKTYIMYGVPNVDSRYFGVGLVGMRNRRLPIGDRRDDIVTMVTMPHHESAVINK